MFGECFCLCMLISCSVFGDEVKTVSVMEGDSVTLNTDLTQIQTHDVILWMFGPQETPVAQIYKQANVKSLYDRYNERFRDRLKLDSQTGSLTITNIRITDSELYKLQIISNTETSVKRFNVTVYDVVTGRGVSAVGWGITIIITIIIMAAVVIYCYCKKKSRQEMQVLYAQSDEQISVVARCPTPAPSDAPAVKRVEMDNFVLAEGLSAFAGFPVKLQSECLDSKADQLDVMNLLLWDLRKEENPLISDEFFDPEFDCVFTHSQVASDSECTRGGEPYKRPYGWMRFGLKVRDKYPDGNDWLGSGRNRRNSVAGEWPVSYHGTSFRGAEAIIKDTYKTGWNNIYGRGIYSTPDINEAERYSLTAQFTSERNGKIYEVILQNRINPKKRVKIIKEVPEYWLIPVPEGTPAEEEKEIVQSSIRPYGLLLREKPKPATR